LALAAPFVFLPIFARFLVAPIGDAAAARIHVPQAPAAAPVDDEDDDDSAVTAGAPVAKAAQRRAGPIGSAKKPRPPITADAAAPPAATIVVPATVVQKALDEKKAGASDAVDADGKPYGARIHGVSRYETGLQNGDVIIEVGGTRVTSTKEVMEAGMKLLASGATRLTGKIARGASTYTVVLELPKPPQ
jgi:hypothetical protein